MSDLNILTTDILSPVGSKLLAVDSDGNPGVVSPAVVSGGMLSREPAMSGHMLLTPANNDTAFRLHLEPKGRPVGVSSKLDLMFDPYNEDSANYRILNAYTKTFDSTDLSTTKGNNGVAVIGAKGSGSQWGIFPTIHFGFSDDGADSAVPVKMYYFDTSDTAWRENIDGAWRAGRAIVSGRYYLYGGILYQAESSGIAGTTPITHTSGSGSDGLISFVFVRNYNTSSSNVRGCLVVGNRDDLPKFGFPNVRAQFAGDALFWNGKKMQFLSETAGVLSGYVYATSGLGSDEIRIETESNRAVRLNKTNKFLGLVGLSRVIASVTDASLATTTSVSGTENILFNNASTTSVTGFLSMLPNQVFFVESSNSNTTLVHGTNLRLIGGVNKTLSSDDVLIFKVSGSGTVAKQVI